MLSLSLVFLIVLLVLLFLSRDPVIETGKKLSLDSSEYAMIEAKAPRLEGLPLLVLSRLIALPVLGDIISMVLLNDNEFHMVRELAASLPFDFPPRFEPFNFANDTVIEMHASLREMTPGLPEVSSLGRNNKVYRSMEDIIALYKAGKTTPIKVVEQVLDAIEHSQKKRTPALNAFSQSIRELAVKQAAESTLRYQDGTPRALEGIPVSVKEGYEIGFGYDANVGTKFIHFNDPSSTSQFVKKLMDAGAVIVGMNNMIELGVSTIGYNHHYGVPRNPHNPNHYTGGSSSGSSAAVAAGIVPLAVGGDGGGSIRIPAGLCGVPGLKVTHGRISVKTALDTTLEAPGPIAATVRDVALGYLVMSENNEANSYMLPSEKKPPIPKPHVHQLEDIESLNGIRIAFLSNYTSQATQEMRDAVKKAITILTSLGATVDTDNVYIPHLKQISRAHSITILAEMCTGIDGPWEKHHLDLGPEARINFAIARKLKAKDYIATQRVRGWATEYVKEKIFSRYDVIIIPATGQSAPQITESALAQGESDLGLVLNLMRYAYMANFLGFPAGVVPVGFTKIEGGGGLPLSVQFMADHWNEHIILRLMRAIEAKVAADAQKKPQVFYDLFKP